MKGMIHWLALSMTPFLVAGSPMQEALELDEHMHLLEPLIGPEWVGGYVGRDAPDLVLKLEFKPILGGNAIRYTREAPSVDFHSETIFYWSPDRQEVRFLSFYNREGVGEGVVAREGSDVVLRGTVRSGDGIQEFKTIWHLDADGILTDTFLRKQNGQWVEGHVQEFRGGGHSTQLASEPVDERCALPTGPTLILRDGEAVLLTWKFPNEDVYERPVLPMDNAYLAYRAAIRADHGDLRRPVADQPLPRTEEEADNWRDEHFNHELAQSGEVGSLEPITCLDALMFACQNARVFQLERPTEFLASVLRKEAAGGVELAIVFGAGNQLFPPKSVYGFNVVREYLAQGWTWWYALHNHTIQRNGDLLALGSPTLSTSDVQLARGLAEDLELENARVTNGFFTFSIAADELWKMRSR